jgi:hypothetical protein
MGWPLAILLLIIFICFSVILFLQFPNFTQYIEIYFLVVILILFIILIFAIDFNNPISYTINFTRAVTEQTKILDVPYNEDSTYSNLMSATFTGTYSTATTPVNGDAAGPETTKVFNYDTLETQISMLGGKILIDKLPNNQIKLTIRPGTDEPINGFFNLSLLCTSSQDIDGSFSEVSTSYP